MKYIIDSEFDLKEYKKIIKTIESSVDAFNFYKPYGWKNVYNTFIKIPIQIQIIKRNKNFWATAQQFGTSKYIERIEIQYCKDALKLDVNSLYFISSHEIAHAIDFVNRGDSWHDSDWKKICGMVGAQPTSKIEVNIQNVRKDFPAEYEIMKKFLNS